MATTTATRTRRYTANMAQYRPHTQTITAPDTNGKTGILRHHVMTRHGAVRRSFLPGPLLVSIALWRPGNLRPQWQGDITRDAATGLYQAATPDGRVVATTTDYLDAEAALLPLKNRKTSHDLAAWPASIRRELERMRNPLPANPCRNCGHPMSGGECTRPDLHW